MLGPASLLEWVDEYIIFENILYRLAKQELDNSGHETSIYHKGN